MSSSAPPTNTTNAPLAAAAAVPPAVTAETVAPAGPKTDRRFVVAALMLVMVLASMEMTVTSTAMPTIIGELHGLEHYAWVSSVYLLACTITMPFYGRLSDVWGRKRVLMGAIGLFIAGSVLAAFADSMPTLVLYRGLQGLGAGGIMPVVLTILGDLFTLEERAKMQGLFSSVWGLSSLAGPIIGAFLVANFGWRWVFLVNLPFGVLGSAVLLWKYHDRQTPHSTELDLTGIMLLALASATLLAFVSRLGPDGWGAAAMLGLGAITVVSGFLFVRQERRSTNPVMPPELMMRRTIGPSIMGTFFFGVCFLSLDTFVPLYVQGGRGGGPGAAAAVVTPVMLTWALSNLVTAPLLIRWGFRKLALVGCVLIVLGFTGLFLCGWYAAPRWVITLVLTITGFGFGPASMAYLLAAQDAVSWQQRGIVTSGVSFFRTMGGALGIGLMGALFNTLSRDDLARLAAKGVKPAAALDPHLQKNLPPEATALIQHAISSGLIYVFLAMAVIAAVQFGVTFLMPPKKHVAAASMRSGSR